VKVAEFIRVLWQYRHSTPTNALRVAYGCAFKGLPF
jgi:hypothetical protein